MTYQVYSFRGRKMQTYPRWVMYYVITKLPPNSVVAMGNASYHSKVHNELLRKYTKKQGMVDWFRSSGCSADISMRKTVLRDFIGKLKPREEIYKIGQISSAHGHRVTRCAPTLLSHICGLNPIELA
jgi:hypothetical protein